MESIGSSSAIISALISTFGVIISALISFYSKIRNTKLQKYLEDRIYYATIISELREIVLPFSSLSLSHRDIPDELVSRKCEEISQFYMKYQPYFSKNILAEINCLHSCLQSKGKHIYYVKDDGNISICKDKDILVKYIKDISNIDEDTHKTFKKINEHPLTDILPSHRYNIQTRHLLLEMNKMHMNKK